jgi:hypothetical protein
MDQHDQPHTPERRLEHRVAKLEGDFDKHLAKHVPLDTALKELRRNNEMTEETYKVIKGAKGLRSFVVWIAPIVALAYEAWQWFTGRHP